jgi:hypothetical protein
MRPARPSHPLLPFFLIDVPAPSRLGVIWGHAERLYQSLGYVTVGVIPRFARGSTTTQLEPTTIMYKELA